MALTHNPKEIANLFAIQSQGEMVENFSPRYNIAPTQPVIIIRLEQKKRVMRLIRWGLVPSWVKDPQSFSLLINARSETALEKPSFRAAMRYRRCLIPASGYYEWRREGNNKQPVYIVPKSGACMALAGLWEEWIGPDGEIIETMAILTQKANKKLAPIHHRMPVVIMPDQYDIWLDIQVNNAKLAQNIIQPVADDFFEAIPVSSKLNYSGFDSRNQLQ